MIEAERMDEDLSEEHLDRVIALADEFADILDEYDAEIGEALNALSLVLGGVLTYEVTSREAAMELADEVMASVRRGISMAEQNGSAWWVRNKAN